MVVVLKVNWDVEGRILQITHHIQKSVYHFRLHLSLTDNKGLAEGVREKMVEKKYAP